MKGKLHVAGAGIAGLACAVAAARAGWRVALYEAAPQAGGRCRSFPDERLGRLVDNGTHLLLGANRTALAFASAIGGHEALKPAEPVFPFLDLDSGDRWNVGAGRLSAGMVETIAALGLPWCAAHETVAARLGATPAFRRLWRPLCEAILNTAPEEASARLFARTLRATMMRGAEGLRPYLMPSGLSAVFAAPALAALAIHGGELHLRRRLMSVTAHELVFDNAAVPFGPDDRLVLALPPWALADILPALPALPTRTIVNAHFRLAQPPKAIAPFLGILGGTAQWLFVREDVLSVTVSAAERLSRHTNEDIAAILWADASRALGLPKPMPPVRVLKERRATLAHTPDVVRRRPGPFTKDGRVWLAGDWLRGPWPCTIEAAVASGLAAARLAVGRHDLSFA